MKNTTQQKHIDRCISQRGNSYHVHIVKKDDDGLNRTYSKSFKFSDYGDEVHALTEAVKWRDEQERLLKNKLFERYTVGDLYLKSLKLFTSSVKTKARLNNLYNHFLKEFENTKLDNIALEDIQGSLNSKAKEFSQDQLERAVSIWHKVYKVANYSTFYCEDVSARLVVPKSKKPAKPKRTEKSETEIQAVADKFLQYNESHATEQTRYNRKCAYYIYQTARYTGLRPAEILALGKDDIDTENKTISVHKAVGSTMDDNTTVIPTKNSYSTRTIHYGSEFYDLWCKFKEEKFAKDEKKLFAKADGSYWNIDELSDTVYRVSKAAGQKVTLYDLRHHYATKLMKMKVSPAVVRDLMGHSNIAMSIQYGRSTDEDMKEAVELLSSDDSK